jgi:hypothetical protein
VWNPLPGANIAHDSSIRIMALIPLKEGADKNKVAVIIARCVPMWQSCAGVNVLNMGFSADGKAVSWFIQYGHQERYVEVMNAFISDPNGKAMFDEFFGSWCDASQLRVIVHGL